MVVFDIPRYGNALDKNYDAHATNERPLAEISLRDIGVSTNPTADQLQGLKARVFQGASRVELGFSGRGKGSMQGRQTTPEMYGKDERQDIRELAMINEVKLSTHASYGAGPLSGLVQGKFDDAAREGTLHEIQRAIDFAADTAQGGAVVVHAGEFPRSIHDNWGKQSFTGFADEEEKAIKYLVDSETGRIIDGVRKDQTVHWVDWEKNSDGSFKLDENNDLIPSMNNSGTEFNVKAWHWKEFQDYADYWNKYRKPKGEKDITWAQAFYRAQLDARKDYAHSWAVQYGESYRKLGKDLDKLKDARDFYTELESTIPEDELWKIKKQIPDRYLGLVPPEVKLPSKYLEEEIRSMEHSLQGYKEGSMSQYQQAAEYEHQANRAIPIEDYGIERAADTIARAAEFAQYKSAQLKAKGDLKEPISVSVEQFDPEMYGAHPEELRDLLLQARKKFVERNRQRFGEAKATRLAEDHINATFDIGHANMWRKYFQGDPKKSFEQNTEAFNKWLMSQVDMLNKHKLIKHVHISDNFGWNDEHVTPGQGSAPIKEFVKRMKAAGVKDLIVEPGHQDYKALLGGWREFGAPVYGAGKTGQRWSDIQHSYFGRTRSPYFVFGDYAPSREFTLWSQVPLE